MPSLQHLYFDTSNLNAPYDHYPPLRGVGAGSLGSSGLGSLGGSTGLGDDATDYPWREQSAKTRDLQSTVNVTLRDEGYCPIGEDGVLGPATCGAVQVAIRELGMDASPPATCESFTAPRRQPCGGGTPAPAPDFTTEARLSPRSSGGTNYLLIGGIIAAAAIGGALVLKRKKGR